MRRNVLITGGAGFVGCNLTNSLVRFGDANVTVLDNLSNATPGEIRVPHRLLEADVRDADIMMRAMRGQDIVVHLAADTRVVDSIETPRHNFEVNVLGGFNVLEAARKCGVSQVVAASSGGTVLGDAPSPMHENMTPNPMSPYGASKLALEGYLSAYGGAYGMTTTALRFSNVYGPSSFNKSSVVAHFFKRMLTGEPLTVYGDGSQVRDYLFIADLVKGIGQAIDQKAAGVYQLGTGQPTSVAELLDLMRRVTGWRDLGESYAPLRAGEVHTTYCDISKAAQAFGFAPKTSLEEGLTATWAWFQQQYPSRLSAVG